jgi:hypothetical protein
LADGTADGTRVENSNKKKTKRDKKYNSGDTNSTRVRKNKTIQAVLV